MISAPIKYRNQLVYMIGPSRPAPKPIMRKITEIPAIKHKVFTRPCQLNLLPENLDGFLITSYAKLRCIPEAKERHKEREKRESLARKTAEGENDLIHKTLRMDMLQN